MNRSSSVLIHRVIELLSESTPEAIALIYERENYSFSLLNKRANQWAHYLLQSGVGPSIRVGVFLENGPDLVIAVLAVLKAGGICVPLEPDFPLERLEFLLADTEPLLIISEDKLKKRLPGNVDWVDITDSCSEFNKLSDQNPEEPVSSSDPAFIFYTSGSVGFPKGVVHGHGEVSISYEWFLKYFNITSKDCGILRSACHLVGFRGELLSMLVGGAQTVVVRHSRRNDIEHLIDLVIEHGITLFRLTPSLLRVFLQSPRIKQVNSLRQMIVSGEPLSQELENSFYSSLEATLHLGYGATEAPGSVYRTCLPDDSRSEYIIGRPVSISQVLILSPDQQLVADGEEGELYVGGAIVSQGYWNQAKRTAERFIQNPFSSDPEDRLYRTGDMGRMLSDGQIEYIGRNDLQANIRGFRIDLAEIEKTLLQYNGINAVVATVREDRPGDQRLVAYLVGGCITRLPRLLELRDFLSEKLPKQMIPDQFVALKNFPIGLTGKIDRLALPAPRRRRNENLLPYAPAQTELAKKVASIWQALLGLEELPSVNDRFYELGGSSLLAIELIQTLESAFNLRLPNHSFQRLGSVEQTAETLTEEIRKSAREGQPECQGASTSQLPGNIYRAIVALNAGGPNMQLSPNSLLMGFNLEASGEPIYCCGGSSQLAKFLTHRPIIGMRTGFRFVHSCASLLQALAAHYVQEILDFQPAGPFTLIGYSFGARVALKIAESLLTMGYEVKFLGLIDEPLINTRYPGTVAQFIAEMGPYSELSGISSWWQDCEKNFPGGMSVDVIPGDHNSIIQTESLTHLLAERINARLNQLNSQHIPLPHNARKFKLLTPEKLEGYAESKVKVPYTLANTSVLFWGASQGIAVGYHWYDEHLRLIHWAVSIENIPLPIEPDQSVSLLCEVFLPSAPGRYHLVFDLLDKADTWGSLSGGPTETVLVDVFPASTSERIKQSVFDDLGSCWKAGYDPDILRVCHHIQTSTDSCPLSVYKQMTLKLKEWGRFETARITASRGLEQYPADPVLNILSAELAHILDQPEDVIVHVKHLIDFMDPRPVHWEMLGQAYEKSGDHEQAITAYRKALAANDHMEWHRDLAKCLENAEQYAEAVKHWQKAVDLRPEVLGTQFYYACALQKAGQFSMAYDVVQQILASSQGFRENYKLADLLLQLGYSQEALELVGQSPANPLTESRTKKVHGQCLLALGRIEEALIAFRQGVDHDPRYLENWLKMVEILTKHQGVETVTDILEEAFLYHPDNFELLNLRD